MCIRDRVGTIRTFDAGMREKIFADLRNVSEHVAAAHGATVEAVSYTHLDVYKRQ